MTKLISDFARQPNVSHLNGDRIHYLELLPHVFSVCCNDSSVPLERLLRAFQREKYFFTSPSSKRDKLQCAKEVMLFLNAYLYIKFAELNGGTSAHLEMIADRINMRIDECKSLDEAMLAFPTLYNGYPAFYAARISNRNKYSPLIRKALDRLYAFYSSEYNLQEMHVSSLAASLHVSEKYLSARFIRETGHTLSSEINEIRIFSAKLYLQYTDLSLEEIAEKAGFSSQNYFSRRFKASVGMPPKEFRRQIRVP